MHLLLFLSHNRIFYSCCRFEEEKSHAGGFQTDKYIRFYNFFILLLHFIFISVYCFFVVVVVAVVVVVVVIVHGVDMYS